MVGARRAFQANILERQLPISRVGFSLDNPKSTRFSNSEFSTRSYSSSTLQLSPVTGELLFRFWEAVLGEGIRDRYRYHTLNGSAQLSLSTAPTTFLCIQLSLFVTLVLMPGNERSWPLRLRS